MFDFGIELHSFDDLISLQAGPIVYLSYHVFLGIC